VRHSCSARPRNRRLIRGPGGIQRGSRESRPASSQSRPLGRLAGDLRAVAAPAPHARARQGSTKAAPVPPHRSREEQADDDCGEDYSDDPKPSSDTEALQPLAQRRTPPGTSPLEHHRAKGSGLTLGSNLLHTPTLENPQACHSGTALAEQKGRASPVRDARGESRRRSLRPKPSGSDVPCGVCANQTRCCSVRNAPDGLVSRSRDALEVDGRDCG
jgi:hypothetical protein